MCGAIRVPLRLQGARLSQEGCVRLRASDSFSYNALAIRVIAAEISPLCRTEHDVVVSGIDCGAPSLEIRIATYQVPLLWARTVGVAMVASTPFTGLSDRFARLRFVAIGWSLFAFVQLAFALWWTPHLL